MKKNVRDRIQIEMTKRGWSQYRLSRESHVSQSTINSFFNKNKEPTIKTLERICDAFHMTLEEFFHEPHSESNKEKECLVSLYSQLTRPQKVALLNMMRTIVATDVARHEHQKKKKK